MNNNFVRLCSKDKNMRTNCIHQPLSCHTIWRQYNLSMTFKGKGFSELRTNNKERIWTHFSENKERQISQVFFFLMQVVKRVLKLWDRTMHKYRFRTHLWKQYLAFCIAINSKKHFYKALTNALRFLPF